MSVNLIRTFVTPSGILTIPLNSAGLARTPSIVPNGVVKLLTSKISALYVEGPPCVPKVAPRILNTNSEFGTTSIS